MIGVKTLSMALESLILIINCSLVLIKNCMKTFKKILFYISIMMLTINCVPKSYEKLAMKDAKKFFKNIDNTNKTLKHPIVLDKEFSGAMAEQLRRKNIENIQKFMRENCEGSRKYNFIDSYRRIVDEGQKFLAMEYQYCESGIIIMGYEVKDEKVKLSSVWPMNKDQRPDDLFTREKTW